MELSSRNELLKQASREIDTIRKNIKERQIKSQEEWDEFVKSEKLPLAYTLNWKNKIEQLAKKGKIEIDLKKLNPSDRYEAERLINRLSGEINKIETGNIFGYGEVSTVIYLLLSLITLLGVASNFFKDDVSLEKNNENQKKLIFLKKLKSIPSPKTTPPKQMLNWVKSIVSMIKK